MATPVPARVTLAPSLRPILLNSPAGLPPPGHTFDFEDSENLHIYVFITLVIGIVCTTLVLAARIFTKCFIIRQVGWDDYFVITGWVLFMPFCGLLFVQYPNIGKHIWNERLSDLISLLHVANITEIIYLPIILFIKVSILLQYLRIFAPTRNANPAMFWGAHIVLWTNVAFYIVKMVVDILACFPRELQWDPFVSGTCLNLKALIMTVAVFNLVSDFVIFLLPQYSIWRLQMCRQRKVGVAAIFGVGLLACIVSALRVQSTLVFNKTGDVSWNIAGLGLWAIAEISLAIISSSLPSIPRFLGTTGSRISKRFSGGINVPGLRVSKTFSQQRLSYKSGEKPSLRSTPSSQYSRLASKEWPRSLYADENVERDWVMNDAESVDRWPCSPPAVALDYLTDAQAQFHQVGRAV